MKVVRLGHRSCWKAFNVKHQKSSEKEKCNKKIIS